MLELFPALPNEFPVTTDWNSLVTATPRLMRGAQAPMNQAHPRAGSRRPWRYSL